MVPPKLASKFVSTHRDGKVRRGYVKGLVFLVRGHVVKTYPNGMSCIPFGFRVLLSYLFTAHKFVGPAWFNPAGPFVTHFLKLHTPFQETPLFFLKTGPAPALNKVLVLYPFFSVYALNRYGACFLSFLFCFRAKDGVGSYLSCRMLYHRDRMSCAGVDFTCSCCWCFCIET
jgi:hypothetical protein